MITKSIILAATLAVTFGTLTTGASAKTVIFNKSPMSICKQLGTCPPPVVINKQPGSICETLGTCPPPVVVVTPTPPMPKHPSGPIIVINGGDGGYGGGGYNDGISCREGRQIVRESGFRQVHALKCYGSTYTYSAKKLGRLVKVRLNMDGDIVGVIRLASY